jgi:hypothetical protein
LPRIAARTASVRICKPFLASFFAVHLPSQGSKLMADTFETAAREAGGAKSTFLRLIRPSASKSNSETAVLRAEIDGFRLALSIVQDALREERCDKEHWRDEAKRLRQLLAGTQPAIINVPQPKTAPEAVQALALAPTVEPEQALALAPTVEPEQANSPKTEMVLATHSAPSALHQWWERLRSSGKALPGSGNETVIIAGVSRKSWRLRSHALSGWCCSVCRGLFGR